MPSFANGLITYTKQTWPENYIITLADCIRVGDDLGRFRLTGELFEKPLFGIHGSFLMIHSEIERVIGFDVGHYNSVTEDFAQGLLASTLGYRFGYIRAVVEEQSPFNVRDFWKQRCRWVKGIVLNSIYTEKLNWTCKIAVT